MKKLALFLLAAFGVFELGFALSDTRMFFGSSEPAPVAGKSDRPAVEAALARLDAALVKFYSEGDEAPLRALLADPDGAASPLHEWELDRHAWVQSGGPPTLALLERRLGEVSVFGLDSVSATAEEQWEVRADAGTLPRSRVVVRYGFRRGTNGLAVESAAVEP